MFLKCAEEKECEPMSRPGIVTVYGLEPLNQKLHIIYSSPNSLA